MLLDHDISQNAKCRKHHKQRLCPIFMACVCFSTEHTVFCHKFIFCQVPGLGHRDPTAPHRGAELQVAAALAFPVTGICCFVYSKMLHPS